MCKTITQRWVIEIKLNREQIAKLNGRHCCCLKAESRECFSLHLAFFIFPFDLNNVRIDNC